ncbi:hypothetical protein S245_017669 [Arachis hypogaea]
MQHKLADLGLDEISNVILQTSSHLSVFMQLYLRHNVPKQLHDKEGKKRQNDCSSQAPARKGCTSARGIINGPPA